MSIKITNKTWLIYDQYCTVITRIKLWRKWATTVVMCKLFTEGKVSVDVNILYDNNFLSIH
jgi:hypothetical protein